MKRFLIANFILSFLTALLYLTYLPNPVNAVDCSASNATDKSCFCEDPNNMRKYNRGDAWEDGDCDKNGNKLTYYCEDTGKGDQTVYRKTIPVPDPEHCTSGGSGAKTGVGTKNIKDVFGVITPPAAIQQFIQRGGGTGAGGISVFLNNLIILIYIIASVVFIFMILWSAFDWITSGGQKDKLEAARKRLTHAIIGIILFAVAFAVISLVGTFTGFSFTSSSNNAQCTVREEFYLEGTKCIHKFSTGAECKINFEEVSTNQCEPPKAP
jgi:hypothetical protein